MHLSTLLPISSRTVCSNVIADRNMFLIQGFPNMPFVKCLSGLAEVPYQVPPWSLPVAPRMPKNKPKEAYLVPAPKARLYPKVLIAKCLPGGAEDRTRDSHFPPEKVLKTYLVPGWKARLSARHVWKMQIDAICYQHSLLTKLGLL